MPPPQTPAADGDEFDVVDPVTAQAGAAKPAAPAASAAPKHAHSARLVKLAEDVGITAAEIAGLDTPALEREVRYAQQQVRQERERSAGGRAATAAPAAPAVPPPPPAEPELWADSEWAKSNLDPEMISAFKALEADNRALKKQLGTVTQQTETRQQVAVYDAYDSGFEAMGADFAPIFGDGSRHEIAEDKGAVQRRIAVIQAAGVDPNVDSPLVIKRKIIASAKLMFGFAGQAAAPSPADAAAGYAGAGNQPVSPPAPAPAPRNPSNGQFAPREDWSEGATARPTNRNGAPVPKGRAAAVAAVEELQRKNGQPVVRQADTSELEDSLPD